MKKISKVLLFTTLLLLLVGFVSASEVTTDDNSDTTDATVADDTSTVSQNNKISVNNEEDKVLDEKPDKRVFKGTNKTIQKKTTSTQIKKDGLVEVHDYDELKTAVGNAASAGSNTTIRLLSGSYNNTGTIYWSTSGMVLTIDGNGQTINGQEQQVFFNYNGASLVLKNITITNATSLQGGAIFSSTATLTLIQSTLNNNHAEVQGGAIFTHNGNLTLIQSTLNNNNARYGGAIYSYNGNLTLIQSTLNNNHAEGQGGAIFTTEASSTLIQSTLNNNHAEVQGGAIYNLLSNLTIADSIINNNPAENHDGAIYNNLGSIFFTISSETAESLINELTNLVCTLNSQLSGAYNQIDSLNNNITNLTQQLTDANNQIVELNDTINNLTNQLKEANTQITELNDTVNNLTNKLQDANNQITRLNNTVNNLTDQLTEANTKIDSLNNNITNLKQELTKAYDKITELNSTINNLTQQLTTATNEIKTLNNSNKELSDNLDTANKEIETLNNTIKDLTEQLDKANNNIKSLNDTNNKLNEKLNDANTEIETLNGIIEELTRPPLNTTITINPIKSTVGSIVNLTARVKDQNGQNVNGGKVIFKVNGITLKDDYGNVLYATLTDGVATLKYKVQGVWMKNTSYVEAVYGGNENYSSSRTKSTDALNIGEGLAKISLDKSSFTVKSGETITLRAKVVDANGDSISRGKVVFKLNGKTITDTNGKALQVNVVNGEAVLDYTIPSIYSAKTYTLTAVYGGEGYNRSQTNGKLVLNKKGVIINTDSITTTNGKTRIKATITDETGELLVRNTSLAIKINGKTILNGVNSTNGKIDVSFTTTLRPGMYELQIVSGENGIYKTGRMTTVLRI